MANGLILQAEICLRLDELSYFCISLPSRLGFSGGGEPVRGRLATRGQAQCKRSSAFGVVVARYLSAMILNHAVYRAEPQTGALANRLGCVKRIEHPMRFFNAGAVIGKLHHHFQALRASAPPQPSSARLFECIQPIFGDLDEGMEQLMAVAPNFRQVRFHQSFNADLLIATL